MGFQDDERGMLGKRQADTYFARRASSGAKANNDFFSNLLAL
jgi:hypothetical protein